MSQTRTGTNGQQNKPPPSDDAQIVAELNDAADCLRNAARLLEKRLHQRAGTGSARAAAPAGPEERVTTKQLGAIHAISRKLGMDRTALAALLSELCGKTDPASLTRAEASSVIETLDKRRNSSS